MHWDNPIVLYVSLVMTLLSLVFMRKRPQNTDDPQAEFQWAKAVAGRVRIDAETGEPYAYKLVRIPAEMPMSNAAPRIIDPLQRKSMS
jgi:hypothetical protein